MNDGFYACNWLGLSGAAAILCLCVPFSVWAAEFSKSVSPNGGPDIISVVGDLSSGDEGRFVNIAVNSENAIVIFQSRGGNLLAGIGIGKAIHIKGFYTFVPDTIQCASACALAWLGGRVRYMSNTARVGFHAAYVDAGGQAEVSSAGNALVGAYLNQLCLPASAIIYITSAPPGGMQWLNFVDAQRFGIDVSPFDLPARPTVTRSNLSSNSLSSEVTLVTKEVYEFVGATNLSNELSLSYLERKYPEQVSYYGKVLPKASVLTDKKAFFKRWPVRNYAIRPSSIIVICETTSKCRAEGIIDWETSGSILYSKGSSKFALRWSYEDGVWKISSESSQSIERRLSRPGAKN